MHLLSVVEFIGFGLFVGTYGTLVGAGGGFLIVPMMLLVYQATPQQAVGTSLAIVFFNALSGTVAYVRQKRVDYATGMKFALATLPGALLGAIASTYLTTSFFNTLFGLVLIALAVFLIARPEAAPRSLEGRPEAPTSLPRGHVRRTIVDAHGEVFIYTFSERGGLILSFFVGFLSSILGIGGGIIHVPALVHLFGFPAHIATATSHFILAISAGAGATAHIVLGHVLYLPALLISAGVVVGAQIGAALSHRIHGRWLIRLLAAALIFVGIRLVLDALA